MYSHICDARRERIYYVIYRRILHEISGGNIYIYIYIYIYAMALVFHVHNLLTIKTLFYLIRNFFSDLCS